MSEEEHILSNLDIIMKRFSTPANDDELVKAIGIYQSCWNFVKNKYPDLTQLDILRMKKESQTTVLLGGPEQRRKRRLALHSNATLLRELLENKSTKKREITTINDLEKFKEKIVIFHYACTSFSESPVYVTAMAFMDYPSKQITTFSRDSLKSEKEILTNFVKFLKDNHDKIFVTWNQKSSTYGFQHLTQRCKENSIETPLQIDNDRIIDLDNLLEKQFGLGYAKPPKFRHLADLNGIPLTNYVDGLDEISLFYEKEFKKIENSTNRKVGIISSVMSLSFIDKLKVDKNRLPLIPVLDHAYFLQFGDGRVYRFLLLQMDLTNHSMWFEGNQPDKNAAKKELAQSFINKLNEIDFHRLFWAGDGGIFVSKAEGRKNYDIIVDAADMIYRLFENWKTKYADLDTSQLKIRVSAHISEIFADSDPDFIKHEKKFSEQGFTITEPIKRLLTKKYTSRFEPNGQPLTINDDKFLLFCDSTHKSNSDMQHSPKKLTDGPIVQIVNTGAEPTNSPNDLQTKYHPNLRNNGLVPVSNIRIYYKMMDRVVDFMDIIREKDDIKKRAIMYEGSMLPNDSTRVNPIQLTRTGNEVSIVFWLEYDFGVNESTEIIFDVRFKNFQNTGIITYVHSAIVKAEGEWNNFKSGMKGPPI